MKYQMLGYDYEKCEFISHEGYETDICAQFEEGYGYYLYRGSERPYIIKLSEVWIDSDDDIGEAITLQGKCIYKIPHPGGEYGKIKTSGLVSGDHDEFKFIVTLYTADQYFLKYIITSKIFEEVGNIVR